MTEIEHLRAHATGSALLSQVGDTSVVTFGVMVGSRGLGEIHGTSAVPIKSDTARPRRARRTD